MIAWSNIFSNNKESGKKYSFIHKGDNRNNRIGERYQNYSNRIIKKTTKRVHYTTETMPKLTVT